MNPPFGEYAKYYDVIYSGKDYATESGFTAKVVRQFSPEAKTILDLGCGTGSHLKELMRLGFEGTGIDRSRDMIANAIKKNPEHSDRFHASTIAAADLHETFDAVISLFHVMSYQTTDSDIASFFRTVSRHMGKASIALVDYWYTPAVLGQGLFTRKKEFSSGGDRIFRTVTPERVGSHTIKVNIHLEVSSSGKDVVSISEDHFMRSFTPSELQVFAAASGLQLVHSGAWQSREMPHAGEWSAYSVFRLR